MALAQAGATVRILARRSPASDFCPGLELQIVRGDLEDRPALAALTTGAVAVVHAAGLIKAKNAGAFLRANRDGAEAMARSARRYAPSARFILVSSLAARAPWLSDYAASKRAGEEMARAAYAKAPEQLIILRPPAIYGPWDRETLKIFKTASRGIVPIFGQSRVTCIHAADAAATIARLALGEGEAGLYGLADGNPTGYLFSDIMRQAARATGARRPLCIQMPPALLLAGGHVSGCWAALTGRPVIFTAGKAREMLYPDWSMRPEETLPAAMHRPEIDLVSGFRDTVSWYRANGWF
jgi:nucleoside-diphosphate-sugar epimerase